MKHVTKSSCFFVVSMITAAPAFSTDQSKVLNEIASFAERVCQTAPVRNQTAELELSGKANTELKGLLAKLTLVDLTGAAQYKQIESEGVLQKDLAALLSKSTDCKQKISDKLINRLIINQEANAKGSINLDEYFKLKRIEVFNAKNWNRVRRVGASSDGGPLLEVELEQLPIPGSIEVYDGVLLMPEQEYQLNGRILRFPADTDKPVDGRIRNSVCEVGLVTASV